MQLESARALKQELLGSTRRELRSQDLGLPAARPEALGPQFAGLALGIAPPAPGERAGGHRLAVRVQHPALVGSATVAAIERAARGEADVRYVGRVTRQQQPGARRRPLVIGASIGHHEITAGTLGAFVLTAAAPGDDGAPRVLSNNHVLAVENTAAPGDEILQPGPYDGGRRGTDRVGVLERFVTLRRESANRVDGALARLDPGIEIDPVHPVTSARIGPPLPPEQATEVLKRGRTTGVTRGHVTAFEVDGVVVDFSLGALRFDDQVEVQPLDREPFSQGGDSGSLIIAADGGRAVALLFAGSDQGGEHGTGVTYGNPIGAVFEELAIERFA